MSHRNSLIRPIAETGGPNSSRQNKIAKISLFLISVTLLGLILQVNLAVAQEPVEPLTPPDGENGLSIFTDRCSGCHGPLGAGDGDKLPPGAEIFPPDFTSEEFRRTAVPSEMFQMITEGRLEALMPPFGPNNPTNPIPTAERWDLVAAVYGLATPGEAVQAGSQVYEENCLVCHGENGTGDGPEAANQESQPTDLTDLRYWTNRSNQMVFDALVDESITGHTYTLEDSDLWAVVDYSRTFSYGYFNPEIALEPIPSATISGVITNGTSGETLAEGDVVLRTFTTDLNELDPASTSVDADGRFNFELNNVPPDLVYLASFKYGDLDFNSAPNRLDRNSPDLDMPIVVYEKTTNPSAISIEQVHMVFDFLDDRLQVSEIYVINNNESAVFVGKSGDAQDGTVELALPDGAENVAFQRSFDSFGNFRTASEIKQTDTGWADTVPLRPGQGAMNLLITYDLPYKDGMTLAHPLFYDTANATIMMPDRGVSLEGDDWQNQGSQQMGDAGSFVSYGRPGLAAGDALSLQLTGKIGTPSSTLSSLSPTGNETTNGLIIGGFFLLLALAGGYFVLRSWQQPAETANSKVDTQPLLRAVANLDDAFEAGEINQEEYQRRREKLMAQIINSWQL